MAGKTQVQEEVSPNLIPMIDIMFLLLLFFMLGADMGQRELEEVRLPKALAVREDKETVGERSDRLTINVYHLYDTDLKAMGEKECGAFAAGDVCREERHWRIAIKGVDYTDPKKLEVQLKLEADAFRTDPKNPRFSERPAMVRADASAPFGEVQKVINTCAKAGIYKVECGAARPPDKEFADTKASG